MFCILYGNSALIILIIQQYMFHICNYIFVICIQLTEFIYFDGVVFLYQIYDEIIAALFLHIVIK